VRVFKHGNLRGVQKMQIQFIKDWGMKLALLSIIFSLLVVITVQQVKTMKVEEKLVQANEKVQSLSIENENLIYEHEMLIVERDMSLMKSYMEVKAEDNNASLNGYMTWMEHQDISEQFYVESKGKFKKTWGLFLAQEASRYNVDPYIVYELIKVESGYTFDPNLVGPKTKYGHAYGMTQFMKNTAPWIANMADLPYEDEMLFDPLYSIQLAIVYLDFLHNRYGNWDKALTAYNRGIYGLEAYIQSNGHAKSSYAVKIQNGAKKQKYIAYNSN
jgi:soluble lytic murein transglycosylase-like protein